MTRDGLQLGTSDTIITPGVPSQLAHRSGTDVHDELHARVLALRQGGVNAALVGVDLMFLAPPRVRRIRARASQLCGIDGSAIFLCCSHTHSSPVHGNVRCWESRDEQYIERTVERIARGISEAFADMAPAAVAYGECPLQIGFNRRLHDDGAFRMDRNPDGPVDRRIRVLAFTSPKNGDVRALFFSHGCHPVVIHRSTPAISADYPGAAAAHLPAELGSRAGPGFLPVFGLGCAGDANPEVINGTFADLDRIGGYVAWAAARAAESARPLANPTLSVQNAVVNLPVLEVGVQEAEAVVAACATEMERLEREGDDQETVEDFPECGVAWSRDLLRAAREGAAARGIPMDIGVLAFGDEVCLVGLQSEVFTRYQQLVAADLPFRSTVVLSCVGGSVAYLPTAGEFDRGGYEVAPRAYTDTRLYAFKYKGTFALDRRCEEAVRGAVRALARA